MAKTTSMMGAALVALLAVGSIAPSADAQERGGRGGPDRWDWNGGGRDDTRGYELSGPGVGMLIPELREDRRARAFVMRNFDFDRDGRLDPREARAANDAFIDAAGPDRGRFDWERRGPSAEGPRAGRQGPPRDWDRPGMRGYRMRQGRDGAVFNLSDVLFQTGSAVLRPGAAAQLRPLAGYLRANPQVRIRVDGFTDSVGSNAANLTLSRNRAAAVGAALRAMDVDRAQMDLRGHGEATPVATNGTAAGRQLNRRVEVTLIGQRASSFN